MLRRPLFCVVVEKKLSLLFCLVGRVPRGELDEGSVIAPSLFLWAPTSGEGGGTFISLP